MTFSEFVAILERKIQVVKIGFIKSNAFVPSSKTCSNCGALKEDLSLKDRERAYSAPAKIAPLVGFLWIEI
ncbi:transposase [Helicobacter bizzozeronii]|uniref:transposase n=1 Tax=Helicobacter bizzozeronii TaxID=56877 RepID=UPI001F270541|nr:transposase [Helicobacter bizzozeronii]